MSGINQALWIEHGDGAARAHPVCILGRRGRETVVRLLDGNDTAARAVKPAEIVPAAPLSPHEEAEYQRLDRELAGTLGDKRKLRRFNALRLRSLACPGPRSGAGGAA